MVWCVCVCVCGVCVHVCVCMCGVCVFVCVNVCVHVRSNPGGAHHSPLKKMHACMHLFGHPLLNVFLCVSPAHLYCTCTYVCAVAIR